MLNHLMENDIDRYIIFGIERLLKIPEKLIVNEIRK